jgi:hypothetical protein
MNTEETKPTRTDVLYGFDVEYEATTQENLKEWQEKYPEHADDLLTLFTEITREDNEK